MKTAVVVGGGLAGLTAARALAASRRVRPVVLESEGRLGGRAASWRDASGALHEVGLHVCFPHYRHVLRLLDELGESARLAWGSRSLSFVHSGGEVAHLRFPRLPAPFHGALAIARHGPLGPRDRLSAVLGAAEATLSTPGWRSRYEGISFAEWARRRGLSRQVLAYVFEPIVGGLTFLRGDQVSARAMLDYIHAVGSCSSSCRVGLFRAGSGEVLVDPLAASIKRDGGEIRLDAPVRHLMMEDGRVRGVRLRDGSTLQADIVVAAVPSHALDALVPNAARCRDLAGAARLHPVPVASLMLWFDRRLGGPAGLRLSPGCAFNAWADMSDQLPELAGCDRSVLQLVVAPLGPDDADDSALVRKVVADVRKLLPGAHGARVERAVVTRTPRSVHAVVPGAQALRPEADVGIAGLLLAGDFVRTGHNPNMESAVASGMQAARLALEALA